MIGIKRIENLFATQKAFVGYLTAGDGGMEKSLQAALALIAGGVNLLEIGMPFSDPIADGPVIQRAATRSLQQGTTIEAVLDLTKAIRAQSDIPIILFSYYNPILSLMERASFSLLVSAGVDGVLLVDCPLEEADAFQTACLAYQLAPIYVVAPTTTSERIRKINQAARGFIYYACRKGTTGVRNGLPDDFAEKITAIKANVNLPVVVGFGIAHRATAEQVLNYADGFVIGSLFVKALEEGNPPATLTKLAAAINPLLNGMDDVNEKS